MDRVARTKLVTGRFTEQEHHALCRWREDRGHESLSDLLRSLVAAAIENHDAEEDATVLRQIRDQIDRLDDWLGAKTGQKGLSA